MEIDADGRVAIVTGAGRGLGREYALELASLGMRVVVADNGVDVHGGGGSKEPAQEVAAEVRATGGEAVAFHDDVADFDAAEALVIAALSEFGRLDVLVNNAGILRDSMLATMDPEEWDEVVRVHLRGTFAPTRWAVGHWRARAKAGEGIGGRVINVSSPSGLYGNIGQTNYGAAKAGIAAFTIIAARELGRYGVAVNAIAPGARTRMTEGLGVLDGAVDEETGFDALAPENVAPLVGWLATAATEGVTGRVFNVWGGHISIAEGWVAGPSIDKGGRWSIEEIDAALPRALADAAPGADMWGRRGESEVGS